MSTLTITESFQVDAPAERVWQYLIDPERVVVCLPGAALDRVEDARTFHGHMRVKVGPVTVSYKGTVEIVELEHEARRVVMKGTGRERGGSGTARMTMQSTVEALEGGGARVRVESRVQLAGRIVRFGRGMIQSVSEQVFQQFTACVTERLAETSRAAEEAEPAEVEGPGKAETGEAGAREGGASEAGIGEGGASEAGVGEGGASEAGVGERPTHPAERDDPGSAGPPAPQEPAGDATGEPAGESAAARGAAASAASGITPDARVPAAREPEPLRLLPILFKAFWAWITRPFRRLFGRKPRGGGEGGGGVG